MDKLSEVIVGMIEKNVKPYFHLIIPLENINKKCF